MKLGIIGSNSIIYRYFKELIPDTWEVITVVKYESVYKVRDCNIIINFAAFTNVKNSDYNKFECWNSNFELVRKLIIVCEKYEIPLLHLSTLYVNNISHDIEKGITFWSGEKSYYTLTKYLAEQLLFLSSFKSWGIIRTDSIFGCDILRQDKKFTGKIIKKIKLGGTPELLGIRGIRPTYAKDVAKYIFQLLLYFETDMIKFEQDVFQATNSICPNEVVSLSSYFQEITKVLNLPRQYILSDVDVKHCKQNFINSGLRHWKEALKDYIENDLQA